jgi:dolichol-phosphate mannosyltransferase
MSDSVTHIVLPAYNEEACLPSLLGRLGAVQGRLETKMAVWVVDDGSVDTTADIARKGMAGLDVRLVSHETNLGLGKALMTGIVSVLEAASDQDIIVVMDADDTHDVGLIIPMSEKISRGTDIVIASRFAPGGDDTTAPPFRRLLSHGAAITFKTILPIRDVRDFTCGYRAYKAMFLRRAHDQWGEGLVQEQGFACMVELLLKLRHLGPRIEEVPMVLRYDRKESESKLKLWKTLMQYLKLIVRDRMSDPPGRSVV